MTTEERQMEHTTTTDRPAEDHLVAGVHHVAIVSRDLDRFLDFWTGLLGTTAVRLPAERGVRHAFVPIDAHGTSVLHAFEWPDERQAPYPADAMFRRGRLDHVAVAARDEAALLELRDRLTAAGASDGSVRLFGGRVLSVHGIDPDGLEFEVCCNRTGEAIDPGELDDVHGLAAR
jgi:catechol 2,3-dioxygenase-like lactoylglutathione lyase family enzyme